MKSPEIFSEFGRIEVDIIQSYSAISKILSLESLKELRMIIRRPNPDDLDATLASVIEQRLSEQHGDEYEEILRAKGAHNLDPNLRTRSLANIAIENGHVHAKSLVNGVMAEQDTTNTPLTEATTFKPDQTEQSVFMSLASKLFARIAAHRSQS